MKARPRRHAPAALGAAFFMLLCLGARAAGPPGDTLCMPLEAMGESLAEAYGETPIWAGRRHDGVQFILAGNADTGTWTLLGVSAVGRACVLDTGTRGRRFPAIPAPPPDSEGDIAI